MQSAYKFSRRVIRPLVIFWLLSQSMVLCALGQNLELDALHTDPSIISSQSEKHIVKHFESMEMIASGDMAESGTMNRRGALMESAKCASHIILEPPDRVVIDIHDSSQIDGDCCGEKGKTTKESASLLPVGAVFFVFWLVRLVTRRLSLLRWRYSPVVGYHHPRFHIVNCSFLN
ncbi:hypothetical protein [Hahella ganghwensis]|uniref:hypothetical protein n=1 Tax=Hahella ganghwensis TaxID=286420 RepID=UPI0004759BF0|nr:hypothetical protein [Hahella ganghwensis]